jgi:RNA recognition motif-containing protein
MKIYVGNLSYQVTEQEMKSAFSQYGEVTSSSIIHDRATGQSRGFGFVEMPVRSDAERAVKELNGAPLKGRNLRVNEARQKEDRPAGRPRRSY